MSHNKVIHIISCFGLLLFLLTSSYVQGQHFWNADFEYGTSNAQPRKWSIEGEGNIYHSRLDHNTVKSGKYSLKLSVHNATVYAFLPIDKSLIAGKNISITGYLKTNNATTIKAGFMFLNPVTGKRYMASPQSYNTHSWTKLSYSINLPHNYQGSTLLVAFVANGTGHCWLDDVIIQLNGKIFGKDPPDFRAPTSTEISQLNQQLFPIHSVKPVQFSEDLVPFKKITHDTQIIALGENSHGSSTIYQFKLRLIQYLVKVLGFNLFALECPAAEADKVNAYVLGGKGSGKKVIKHLIYRSWQTKEMLAIIEWLRKHNLQTHHKVRFLGFDMQYGQEALAYVTRLKHQHVVLTSLLDEVQKHYQKKKKNAQDWKIIQEKGREIKQFLATHTSKDFISLSASVYAKSRYFWNIFLQSIHLQKPVTGHKNRDAYLADNIRWLKTHYHNSKIIISADNDHVRKTTGKMGYSLYKTYHNKYLVLGVTFDQGTYQAYGNQKFYKVHPSYTGTYEYLFSQAKVDNFFLDLTTVQHIPLLNQSAGFRTIGSRPQETTQFMEMNLKDNFDIIVFLKNSTHTKYLQEK